MKQPHFEHVCECLDPAPVRVPGRTGAPLRLGTVEGMAPVGRMRKVG